MRIKKLRRGSAGPYKWERDGEVVDVDDRTALELMRMPGFQSVDPEPEPVWVPGAVAEPLPVVRTHIPIRKEKVGGAASYNWSEDGAVVLVDLRTAMELLRMPGFSEADEAETDIRDIEGTAQKELTDPAKIRVGALNPPARDPNIPQGAERIIPKSQRAPKPA
jgi:hypothetical protein